MKWPSIARVINVDGTPRCTGVIISDEYILTSADCCSWSDSGEQPADKVIINHQNDNFISSSTKQYKIIEIYHHPNNDYHNRETLYKDYFEYDYGYESKGF